MTTEQSTPLQAIPAQPANITASGTPARTLFPPIEPYRTFRLAVDTPHELYVEEVGNPQGQPVVFLHGGPGAGISENHRRLFDPVHYRIVLFDQRGSGKSAPHACLEKNTTWDLVADIEAIRVYLGIEHWLVFGGSWGSTLSLAYAQTHPERVTGLILRGIFLCRPEEIQWFYQSGCHWMFPDLWEEYLAPLHAPEHQDLQEQDNVSAYYRLLTHPDEQVRLRAAKAWSTWEAATCHLLPDEATIQQGEDPHHVLAMARIECHYFMHQSFLEENQLLRDIDKIRHIPTVIVQGRYDIVCPPKSAWDLHQAFPEAEFHMIRDAGHAYNEPGILHALITATENFKSQL